MWVALLASAVVVAGLVSVHRASDPAPPGPGDPIPEIRLDAVESGVGQLRDWARPRARRFGIPERALTAYGYASVVMAKAQPTCHLGWTTLAGIARVESDHARFGGATIAPDGTVRPPIRGVPLNGTAGNALILDPATRPGHPVYARAQGPFQFIPDTWTRWGVTAATPYATLAPTLTSAEKVPTQTLSGSPDNIDDAALAAARYLCASGGDLATPAGWRRAVFAYNHSNAYVAQVRTAARGFDA
ncbi:murein transglycosylase [Nocardia sp. NPDC005978]|uniref:murein transglycosylase n=1 Tax=Nocardia sp. NPDC005978 TaxID=3156725 RepID=UPI0033BADAB0